MRKIWVIGSTLVAIILIVILAVPLVMGLLAQKYYPRALSQFNTPHVSFELLNFKRGWFHSRAQLQVTFHYAETTLSGDAIPLVQFTVDQKIQHGLLIRQNNLDGAHHWAFARAAVHNESQGNNLNFRANTLWTLTNKWETQLQIQHLLLGNDRQRVEINQLAGQINFAPGDTHFQSQLTLDNGVLYENNPERVGNNNIIDLVKVMELDHFATHIDIHKIKTLWYGNRHFEAEKIIIFPYTGESVAIDKLVSDLNQNQHGELTNFNIENRAETVSSGPFKISQLQIALALKEMNTSVLENFAQVFMYGSNFQRLKLYSLLIDLFAKGMIVDLSQFHFVTPDGLVSVQGQIASTPTETANSGLLHWLENLNIEASANVSKEWLKKTLTSYFETKKNENPHLKMRPEVIAQRYIDQWLAQHLLIATDGQVTMALHYKAGQLLINGEKPELNNLMVNDSLNDVQ